MKKLKLIFYIKNDKTNSEGLSAIYCKIIIGKTNATFTTGKYISVKRWDETNHLRKVVKKEEDIKSYLKIIEDKLNSIFLESLKTPKDVITASELKLLLLGSAKKSKTNHKTVLHLSSF